MNHWIKKNILLLSPHPYNTKTVNSINLSRAAAQQNPKPPDLPFSPHRPAHTKRPFTSTKAKSSSPSLSHHLSSLSPSTTVIAKTNNPYF
jgi:hypothetical protein